MRATKFIELSYRLADASFLSKSAGHTQLAEFIDKCRRTALEIQKIEGSVDMSSYQKILKQLVNHEGAIHDPWTRMASGGLFLVYKGARLRVKTCKDGWQFKVMMPGEETPLHVSERYSSEVEAQFEATAFMDREI